MIKQNKVKNNKKLRKQSSDFYLDEDNDSTLILSNDENKFDNNFEYQETCINNIFHNKNNLNEIVQKNELKKKFKTEICKNFQIKGICIFEDKCSFAHGEDELRDKIIENNLYKTKDCIAFEQDGYCRYGYRCQYIHSDKNYFKSLENFIFRIFSYHETNKKDSIFEIITSKIKINNEKLKIFHKLNN